MLMNGWLEGSKWRGRHERLWAMRRERYMVMLMCLRVSRPRDLYILTKGPEVWRLL